MSNRRELVIDGISRGRFLVCPLGPWFPDDLPPPIDFKARFFATQKHVCWGVMSERFYTTHWHEMWEHGTDGGDIIVTWVQHDERLYVRKNGPADADPEWELLSDSL